MSKLLRAQYTYCLVVLLMSTHQSISKILATFDDFSYFFTMKKIHKNGFLKLLLMFHSVPLFEWLFLKMIFLLIQSTTNYKNVENSQWNFT